MPEIYPRNEEKRFPPNGCPAKKRKKESIKETVDKQQMIESHRMEQQEEEQPTTSSGSIQQVILEAELDQLSRNLQRHEGRAVSGVTTLSLHSAKVASEWRLASPLKRFSILV